MDRRKQLENLMKKYVSDNCIDISKFRKENPNEYALIPHYFGGINKAIEVLGWVKVDTKPNKEGRSVTLKNLLAYEALKILREENTLEEIADKFGVTRPAINQLYYALQTTIENQEQYKN